MQSAALLGNIHVHTSLAKARQLPMHPFSKHPLSMRPASCTRSPPAPAVTVVSACREHETKFLVRTLVSNLRVGANWRSVIGAMARAVVMHREGSRVAKARLDAAATAASEAYHVGIRNSLLLAGQASSIVRGRCMSNVGLLPCFAAPA